MRKTAFIVKPLLFLSLLAFTSCGVWDFFAAYFNTYYNAKRQYDEAVEEVWNMPEVRESGRNMLILPPISQPARVKFTSVIEKCSKLLQYHPESNLVDDALLMIGQSYFYQAEYQQAQRKFNEILDRYASSDLVSKTKVLLSYTLYKNLETAKAEEYAAGVLKEATEQDDRTSIADVSLLLAQIALEAKQYSRARVYFQKTGEFADEPDKRALAMLKVAEMYIEERDFKAAEEAYRLARGLSNGYVGEYRGLIGAARMLAKQERFDAAHDALNSLRDNNNYREYFGEIDVEIGHVYRDQDDLDAAIEQYQYVDTAYARTENSVNADYALGMLYESRLQLYDSAKVVYDKGRGGPPQALVMPEMIRRSDYLARYLQYRKEANRLDSTLQALRAATNIIPAISDSARVVGASAMSAVSDSAKAAANDMLVVPDSARVAASAMSAVSDSVNAAANALQTMSDSVRVATNEMPAVSDSAKAAVSAMLTSDSAKAAANPLLTLPDVQRRAAAPMDSVSQRVAQSTRGGRTDSPQVPVAPSQHPDTVEKQVPVAPPQHPDSVKPQVPVAPPQHPDTVKKHLAAAIDNLAGVLYINMGMPDSARSWYQRIVTEFPESPVAPRALYVLARIEAQDSTATSAVPDSLYHLLIERYPSSVFADEARRLVGMPAVQKTDDAAEGSYSRGVDLLQSGKNRAAIDTFVTVAGTYPQSPAASRALYAAGWTYENHTPQRDSVAALYERLVALYPATVYAQRVLPRVQEVQTARRLALEKAKADSVAKAQSVLAAKAHADSVVKARADSLAKAHPPSAARARADLLAKARAGSAATVQSDSLAKARADSAAAVHPDSLGNAPVAAPPDTLKAKPDPDKEEQLMEERRRVKKKPAELPPGKPTRPRETPEEKPID